MLRIVRVSRVTGSVRYHVPQISLLRCIPPSGRRRGRRRRRRRRRRSGPSSSVHAQPVVTTDRGRHLPGLAYRCRCFVLLPLLPRLCHHGHHRLLGERDEYPPLLRLRHCPFGSALASSLDPLPSLQAGELPSRHRSIPSGRRAAGVVSP